MRTRRKQSKQKQTLLAIEEATEGVFTDEELKSRLEVALREALSVAGRSSPELRRPLSSFETNAEETLYLVNDFDH